MVADRVLRQGGSLEHTEDSGQTAAAAAAAQTSATGTRHHPQRRRMTSPARSTRWRHAQAEANRKRLEIDAAGPEMGENRRAVRHKSITGSGQQSSSVY